jgi:hypothetical protein
VHRWVVRSSDSLHLTLKRVPTSAGAPVLPLRGHSDCVQDATGPYCNVNSATAARIDVETARGPGPRSEAKRPARRPGSPRNPRGAFGSYEFHTCSADSCLPGVIPKPVGTRRAAHLTVIEATAE